jgi:RHS repeat-associated protein
VSAFGACCSLTNRSRAGGCAGTNYSFLTSKERDNETALDYFEARYFSSDQGRFTSVDPVFFQKEMLIDPQRYNQYSYVRNNPLKFVDPKGEAIELMGDEEHRRRTLEQLRKAVGAEAGAYLYENKGKDGKYYVGIYTNGPDGKGKAFGEINSLAQGIGAIIGDSRIARVGFVSDGTKVEGYRPKEKVTITAKDALGRSPSWYYLRVWLWRDNDLLLGSWCQVSAYTRGADGGL